MVIVWVTLIYNDILTDVDFGDIAGHGDVILMMVFCTYLQVYPGGCCLGDDVDPAGYKGNLVDVVLAMMWAHIYNSTLVDEVWAMGVGTYIQ